MRPFYERDGITIYHGDALAFTRPITADVFVTDPPYSRAGAMHTGRSSVAGTAADAAGSDQFWLYWFAEAARRASARRCRRGGMWSGGCRRYGEEGTMSDDHTVLSEVREYHAGSPPGKRARVDARFGIYAEIHHERDAQDEQRGESDHRPDVWALIVSKHAGRLSSDALEYLAAPGDGDRHAAVMDARRRAIVVAAVCVAFVESIDRRRMRQTSGEAADGQIAVSVAFGEV